MDVFLINARPGVPERLGIDYDSLRAHKPDLIYLENTAYGPTGPSAHRAGADIIAQAYSGLMAGDEKVDEHGGPDLITATTPADFVAAFTSTIAVCAALFHRERTGEGQKIDTSLLAGAMVLQNAFASRMPVSDAVLLDPILNGLAAVRERGGSYRDLLGARGGLRALVGGAFFLYYGGLPDLRRRAHARLRHAARIGSKCAMRIGLEPGDDPTDDGDFNALADGSEEIVAGIRAKISERFASDTTENWIAKLDAAGAPASQVNIPEEMIDDPQVQALGIMVDLDHRLTGPETMVGPPFSMSASPLSAQGASPPLDGDTDEVLVEYGYTAEESCRPPLLRRRRPARPKTRSANARSARRDQGSRTDADHRRTDVRCDALRSRRRRGQDRIAAGRRHARRGTVHSE